MFTGPGQPTGVSVSPGVTSVTVNWNPPQTNPATVYDGFKIAYSETEDGPKIRSYMVDMDASQLEISGLRPLMDYVVHVQTVSGVSSPTSISNAVIQSTTTSKLVDYIYLFIFFS